MDPNQYQTPYGRAVLAPHDTPFGNTLDDAAARSAPFDSLTRIDTELLWRNEDLRAALRAEKRYAHLSISALDTTDALQNMRLLSYWRQHLGLCAYARSATPMGARSAACFDLLACDMGRSIEYVNKGSYVYSSPVDVDDGGSFPDAFNRYRAALGIEETTGIAIIQHPDFASLMRLAKVSIVLCDLPSAYHDFQHVRLTDASSVDAVVNYLCQMRIFDQASQAAESEETSSRHSDEPPSAPPATVSKDRQTRSPLDEKAYNSQVGEWLRI